MLIQIRFHLKDANNVNRKKQFKYANIPSMNNLWIVILWYYIHFFCSVALIGFWCPIPSTPCNFERFCIGNSICSNYINKVVIFLKSCGMNPTPHAKMLMIPNMSGVKHTNKGHHTSCICCTWGLKLIPLKFHFLFYLIKGFFLIPFLLCMRVVQNINIRKSVVLLPKTPKTNRWMPRSTQLHLEAMCLVQVFMKQPPLGCKRTNAYIHIATPA